MIYRQQMRFACLALLLAACGPDDTSGPCKDNLVAGDLVITEVFADYAAPTGGTGTDDGKEWFEIYNNSDRPLSLKGLTIVHSRPDDSKPSSHTMTDVTIAPGQFFTLGNSTSDLVPPYVDYGYSASLGDMYNSGGGKLALRCGDSEIDAAVYDSVKSGRSRQLSNASPPDYTTNDDLAAWCEAKDTEFEANNFGTPGEDNDCAPVVAGACSDAGTMRPAVAPDVGDLVITEVMPKPAAVSATVGQWFEVRAMKSVDLNGVGLDRANDSSGATVLSSASCIHLDAGQYAVFARSDDMTMNGGLSTAGTFSFSLNPTTVPPEVQVVYGATVIDSVAWTTSSTGRSLALDPDFTDATGNDTPGNFCNGATMYNMTANGTDYGTPGKDNEQCAAQPQPGQCLDNGVPRAIVKPAADALVINEFLANAAGTGTDPAQEWFEIVNVGTAAFDLNGLGLQGNTTTINVIQSVDCKPVAPNGFALFAHSTMNNGGLMNVDATFTFSLAQSSGKIQVLDGTTVLDAITWPSSPAQGDGIASQLKPTATTTTGNDDPASFCPATAAQQYSADAANYGTPRAANVCL